MDKLEPVKNGFYIELYCPYCDTKMNVPITTATHDGLQCPNCGFASSAIAFSWRRMRKVEEADG